MRSASTLYIYITNVKSGAIPEMVVNLPFIDMSVPILALFKLLRVNTRNEAFALIVGDLDAEESRLLCSVLDNDTTCDMSYDDLLEWLGARAPREPTRERRLRYLEHIITNEILPHMGLTMNDEVNRSKACYLGFMVRKLDQHLHRPAAVRRSRPLRQQTHRDGGNAHVSALSTGVSHALKTLTSQTHRLAEQNKLAFTNGSEMINPEEDLRRFPSMPSRRATGGCSAAARPVTGVAQMLSRMTSVAALSNLAPHQHADQSRGQGAQAEAAALHAWGIVCPVETPEGRSHRAA